jgi:drug/metabolite transporter (DMT)-like permease
VSNLLRDLTSRFDRTLKSMIYASAAAAAGVASLFFFSLAVFLLLQENYGTMRASLAMGVVYAVLALVAVTVVLMLGRKRPPPPPPSTQPRSPAWWQDPIVITSALQVARSLGPRTIITLAAVGAFVAGILLTSPKDKPPPQDKN